MGHDCRHWSCRGRWKCWWHMTMLRWWLGSCGARKRRSLWWKRRRRDWRLWFLLSARRWVDRGVCVVLFSCAKIVAAENTVERDKKERELLAKRKKRRGRLVFYQLFTRFSSHSGHGIHPYL